MTYYLLSTVDLPRREYLINSIADNRPLQWLKLGWKDFTERSSIGIVYGLLVTATGFLLTFGLISQDLFYLVPVFTAGFLLIAPILAVGLFADAKLRYAKDRNQAERTGAILARNLFSISGMGIILMLIFMNWLMLSNLLFSGIFHQLTLPRTDVEPLSIMWRESLPFIAVYLGIGAMLAACVFRMSAMSIPLMVDQDVDVFSAILVSWKSVGENRWVMIQWAALITGLCLIGFLSLFLGFIFIIPLLGYASWHAYRETLQLESES